MRTFFSLAVFVGWTVIGAQLGQAAVIQWGTAFEIETDADVDVSGEIVRAVNVADPITVDVIEVVFPGDIAVEFEPEHVFEFNEDLNDIGIGGGNVTGQGNFFTGQDFALTTENQDLDDVLDSHGWVGGGPDGAATAVVELTDLTVGTSYQIQLIGPADDRDCCEYRQMQIWDDDLEPVLGGDGEDLWFGRSNDFDQNGERGPGSVIGTFTADATEQYINLVGSAEFDDGDGNVGGEGNDPGISAYVLMLSTAGGLVGDFNENGVLDLPDIDDLSVQSAGGTNPPKYDLTGDSLVDAQDLKFWIGDLKNSWVGDADLNGEFNTGDLVIVLASGTYEVDTDSAWSTGDFNGDGRSDSSDLVVALADGGYENGTKPSVAAAVPEPSSVALAFLGLGALGLLRRRP